MGKQRWVFSVTGADPSTDGKNWGGGGRAVSAQLWYYQAVANAGLRIHARAENHVRGLKQENMQLGALQYF